MPLETGWEPGMPIETGKGGLVLWGKESGLASVDGEEPLWEDGRPLRHEIGYSTRAVCKVSSCQRPIHGNAVFSHWVIPMGDSGQWTKSAVHLGCWKNGRKKGLQDGLTRGIGNLELLSEPEYQLLAKRFDDTKWVPSPPPGAE